MVPRILFRRFETHFLLSALVTSIPQLPQHLTCAHPWLREAVAGLGWSATTVGGFAIHALREARYPSRMAFSSACLYGMAASSLIATLHMITIILGRWVGGADRAFTTGQHIAVQFCLVLFTNVSVLSGTPDSVGEVLLAIALSRFMRQANYVGFWVVIDQVQRFRKRRQRINNESGLM